MTPLLPPNGAHADPLFIRAQEREPARRPARDAQERRGRDARGEFAPRRERPSVREPAGDTVRYYMPVGRQDGIGAREIVGALTHEGGLSGRDIGRIGLMDHYSHVDLPAALNESTIRRLARIHVAQRKLELTLETPELVHARNEVPEAPRKDVRAAPERGAKPARAGKNPGFGKPSHAKGGEKPPRKPRAFAGAAKSTGRGPGRGKPPGARTARNAGTLAIRRKPV